MLAIPAALAAQLTLRIGAVKATYADAVTGSALSVGPRLDLERGPFAASFEGGFSRFTSGVYASQARGDVGVGLPFRFTSRHSAAALVAADYSYLEGGPWSGAASVAMLHGLTVGPVLLTANLEVGRVRSVQAVAAGLFGAGAAVATDFGRTALDLRVQRTESDILSYTDMAARAGHQTGPLTLEGVVGERFYDPWDRFWWRARVSADVSPLVSVETAVGRYAEDVMGFAEGRFASVALRVRLLPGRFAAPRRGRGPRALSPEMRELAASQEMRVAVVAPGQVRVSIVAPSATRVAIAGQWNQWRPQAMTQAGDGRWEALLPLAAGTYKFALLVDGTRWTVPRGVATLPDEFGQSVGLLLVSQR
jgi:hypothetical protein